MRKSKKTILLVSLVTLLSFNLLDGQDVHYSQFYNSPTLLSPGLTGVFGGDIRFVGNYKSQWTQVPVDYQTFTAAVDMKFIKYTAKKGFWSAGAVLNYDKAGYSRLNLIQLAVSGSYTRLFSNQFFGTFGSQIGLGQRAFELGDLQFDQQFDTEIGQYNPVFSNGESFPSTSNLFADISLGVNFRYQAHDRNSLIDRLDKRTKVDFGIGVYHLNGPDQSYFDGEKVPLEIRLSPYVMGTLMLTKSIDLEGNFFGQLQGDYREWVGVLGGVFHISRKLGDQLALKAAFGYRFHEFGDAYIPSVEVQYNQWKVGFNYDINISDFDVATNRRGGPEFSVRYIIRKVRPLPTFRICPLI